MTDEEHAQLVASMVPQDRKTYLRAIKSIERSQIECCDLLVHLIRVSLRKNDQLDYVPPAARERVRILQALVDQWPQPVD